jgi:hypothetical protein
MNEAQEKYLRGGATAQAHQSVAGLGITIANAPPTPPRSRMEGVLIIRGNQIVGLHEIAARAELLANKWCGGVRADNDAKIDRANPDSLVATLEAQNDEVSCAIARLVTALDRLHSL